MQFLQSLLGPNGLILLGAFISTIGVVWSSNLQTNINNKLTEKSDLIVRQGDEIDKKANSFLKKMIQF